MKNRFRSCHFRVVALIVCAVTGATGAFAAGAHEARSGAPIIEAEQRLAAERRVFEFVERGTGRLIRAPRTDAEIQVVDAHQRLLAAVLRPQRVTEPAPVGFVIDDGLAHARGQVMVEGPDGSLRLECISVREFLLGRTPDFRFSNHAPGRMRE